ncbi:MAG TPA: ABC transporter permease [Methanomassiliicoccales archaeon]|jgi:peptide/nickel transport system permease protein
MRMRTFVARRLLLLIPVLIGVTILVFTLTRFGDPTAAYQTNRMTPADVEKLRDSFHLHDDIVTQYFYWLEPLLKGDWGYSKSAGAPVSSAIVNYFPATFELTMVSMALAVVIGIALGTVSAVRKDKPVDHISRIVALSGVSLPIFWLGLILQFIFYLNLGWLPVGGRYDAVAYSTSSLSSHSGFLFYDTLASGQFDFFLNVCIHAILPALTLAFGTIAILSRIMRSSMLEVLGQDYIKTARSKGLPEKVVIKKHARRNALVPTTTVTGLAFGGLLGGAVLTETIYGWPGMGQWSTKAIASNETSSILAFTIIIAFIYVLSNLVVDILYAYLDPRVRLE